ncbi:MAG: energy transducer TonB [Steroidobacteraceae bacterium]|jgi:periplasmic protein TonB
MSAAQSRSAQTRALDEGPSWLLRGLFAAAVIAAVFLAREFVGSRSLRIAEAPQRVALMDAVQPPPTHAEDELKPPPPEEEEQQAPAEGLDNGPVLGDTGPSPIDDRLGVDSDAQAGFDSFGLRAKRGGRDLALDLGKPERSGTGSGGFGAYSSLIATELKSWLTKDDELRRSNYEVRVRVWLDPTGAVSGCKLADTTGDAALDRRIVERISTACIQGEPLPRDLPQPITVLIRSRGAAHNQAESAR